MDSLTFSPYYYYYYYYYYRYYVFNSRLLTFERKKNVFHGKNISEIKFKKKLLNKRSNLAIAADILNGKEFKIESINFLKIA